ncbi:phosphatase PAP2 family protein [Micropruina sonneratiae]|uniref:phosphatase PAP2 family protein n=1 Tax=Micropruina sonneratiae TaxID=2986940 RepID=UPI002225FDC3|nr:phosphatase PAP2 family protein [Micropruina sp. KQZ13P-5]MCW3159279.1 phosphatase PAP2 family protein [Micropruina sp. KQZ13P-5]
MHPQQPEPPQPPQPLRPSESERTIGSRDLTDWRSTAGRWLRDSFGALVDRVRNTEVAVLLLLGLSVALAVGGTVLAGEIYEAVSTGHGIARVDEPLLAWILTVRTPELTAAIAAFSNSGGQLYMTIITAVAVTALCLLWRRWTPLVLMLIAVGGSLAMTVAGKRMTERARPALADAVPPYETSASFPSGHSLNSIVIAGMFCYLLVSHLTSTAARAVTVTLTVLYVLAMGLSRVYLGHHWLTDVLAAWSLGVAWLTVVITSHRLWLTQHQDHRLGGHRQVEGGGGDNR